MKKNVLASCWQSSAARPFFCPLVRQAGRRAATAANLSRTEHSGWHCSVTQER